LDRHIASHPVTVTEGDTVTRASRHIGPPLEGAVNVTLDQPERRKADSRIVLMTRSNALISRKTASQSAARVSQRVSLLARCQTAGTQRRTTDSRRPFGDVSVLNGNKQRCLPLGMCHFGGKLSTNQIHPTN